MSAAQNKSTQPPKAVPSAPGRSDADASIPPSESSSSAEPIMDQHLESTLTLTPPAPPTPPSEVMSSTAPDPAELPADSQSDVSPSDVSSPVAAVSESAVSEPTVSEIVSEVDESPVDESPASEPVAPESVEPVAPKLVAPRPMAPKPPEPVAPEVKAVPEAAVVAEVKAEPEAQAEPTEEAINKSAVIRQQPIPPASEPMQYRAIGLVRGKYVASDEQFTRGMLHTEDGAEVDAVLLGRVMSLVKKHIDLEQSHLWVVYPRTREKVENLHVQIVGVWEPEKLNRFESESSEAASDETGEATEAAEPSAEVAPETSDAAAETASETAAASFVPAEELDDTYFSIRGEIVFQDVEQGKLLVKIRRSPQSGTDESKIFKVAVEGNLDGKVLGYFWDLHVERQGNQLMLREGNRIGIVPPQKRSGKPMGGRGGPRRMGGGGGGGGNRRFGAGAPRSEGYQRPVRSGDRPAAPATNQPKKPFTKPVKRSKETPTEG
ncbi:MAG: hypothetical protein MUF49_18760 [Oculatellaceae cyanobacterium Prado106]|nr:hypothetical protein [Oculatellaceae cyanobacterium Prado106]